MIILLLGKIQVAYPGPRTRQHIKLVIQILQEATV